MPRPNRYHPYATARQQIPSPRYPAPPSFRIPRPLPSITEQPPQPATIPYQYIHPGYIQSRTSDGKPLSVKSVIQSPDGVLHVQMEVARFPSEDIKQYVSLQEPQPTPSPMLIDPALCGLDMKRGEAPRKDSACSEASSSPDGRSVNGTGDECAVVSEDEDAEGEVEFDDKHYAAFMEQQKIIALMRQKQDMGQGLGQGIGQ